MMQESNRAVVIFTPQALVPKILRIMHIEGNTLKSAVLIPLWEYTLFLS